MPAKKQVNSETNALVPSKAALAETIPPITDALTNAVLDRVIQRVGLDGLREKVLDEAAARLAQNVHVDSLIKYIVGQSEQHLADRLSERVLEHIALGAPQERGQRIASQRRYRLSAPQSKWRRRRRSRDCNG